MTSYTDEVEETKARLNTVSPSFCLAKWLQANIELHNGRTRSCCLTPSHQIPLAELARDPSALHNTAYKKQEREQMLNGERPSSCSHCWKVENFNPDQLSDRHFKSATHWAKPFFHDVVNAAASSNAIPSSVEVSFSRTCNFKCSYCSPDYSSSWAAEVIQFGGYAERPELHAAPLTDDSNLYVDAFWKWWPQLKGKLKVFRITGGEPLLANETFHILDDLSLHPEPNLQLAVNSNLGVPRERLVRMARAAHNLLETGKIKSFRLYTSVDAWGSRAEYIRHGLKFAEFWQNVELILEEYPRIELIIMVTLNALSITSFDRLLEECLNLRKKYGPRQNQTVALIDVNSLKHPRYQALNILPRSYQEKLSDLIEFMHRHFNDYETIKLKQALEWMRIELDPATLRSQHIDFFNFFSEHDRRRGTDFAKTFPELNDFWQHCREVSHGRKSGSTVADYF